MRKKIMVLVLILVMVILSCASCGGSGTGTPAQSSAEQSENSLSGKKIGLALMSTSDAVVAQMVTKVQTSCEALGIKVLVSDANNDASAQIDAVENFIQSKCDVIMIQAIDAEAMSTSAKTAMDAGIKVIAYGIGIDNYDVWYKNDNTITGTAIGEMAADWINQNMDGNAKVAIFEFPQVDVLIERVDAIKKVIQEQCPNAEIVASATAMDSDSGYSATETFLAANPDLNCIVSFSDGPACGAYEAVKAAGKDNDNFAVFGSDLSEVAVNYIAEGTCYRGTTDADNTVAGDRVAEIAAKLLNGDNVDSIVVMGCDKVVSDNVQEYVDYYDSIKK